MRILSYIITILFLQFIPNSLVLDTYAESIESVDLPEHIVVGYWENWTTGQNLKLSQIDEGWDVIIVSFMLTDSSNSHCWFTPDDTLYPGGNADFIEDVKFCQNRGQKVLISFGGAIGYSLELNNNAQRDDFYTSCRDIIEYYGFDGFDIDIEQSLINLEGETSMLNPTKPMNINLIYICHALNDYFGEDFILTMAPEHPYVQGGAYWWSGWHGIWGGYLPLLNGVRDILTFIHVQFYNNVFSDYPSPYQQYGKETYIFVTELLINGFDTAKGNGHFDGLKPEQVVLGVITQSGGYSENGELPATEYGEIIEALLGKYPSFRGAMTWSIGNDKKTGSKFLTTMRELFDSLSPNEILKGDINFDGIVNNEDIIILKKHLLKIEPLTSELQGKSADINEDGIVNIFDLIKIMNLCKR